MSEENFLQKISCEYKIFKMQELGEDSSALVAELIRIDEKIQEAPSKERVIELYKSYVSRKAYHIIEGFYKADARCAYCKHFYGLTDDPCKKQKAMDKVCFGEDKLNEQEKDDLMNGHNSCTEFVADDIDENKIEQILKEEEKIELEIVDKFMKKVLNDFQIL